LCTQDGLKRSDDKNHTVRTCPMAAVKCPWTILFGWRFAEKHSETAWGLEKCTCYQGPPRVAVGGNDCFSLANYSHWPRWWELNSLSLSTVHLFRVMGGDGGEICTLDVLNADRGLPLGML
jgi:hypothetical protein